MNNLNEQLVETFRAYQKQQSHPNQSPQVRIRGHKNEETNETLERLDQNITNIMYDYNLEEMQNLYKIIESQRNDGSNQ